MASTYYVYNTLGAPWPRDITYIILACCTCIHELQITCEATCPQNGPKIYQETIGWRRTGPWDDIQISVPRHSLHQFEPLDGLLGPSLGHLGSSWGISQGLLIHFAGHMWVTILSVQACHFCTSTFWPSWHHLRSSGGHVRSFSGSISVPHWGQNQMYLCIKNTCRLYFSSVRICDRKTLQNDLNWWYAYAYIHMCIYIYIYMYAHAIRTCIYIYIYKLIYLYIHITHLV